MPAENSGGTRVFNELEMEREDILGLYTDPEFRIKGNTTCEDGGGQKVYRQYLFKISHCILMIRRLLRHLPSDAQEA